MWNREHGYRSREADMRRARDQVHRGYDRGYAGQRGEFAGDWPRQVRRPRYGGDYWWIGEHELRRRGAIGSYDTAYEHFANDWHPRYSPVGGMHPAMGGWYLTHQPPRPVRENVRFSDWTRWF